MEEHVTILSRLRCFVPDDIQYALTTTAVKHIPEAMSVLNAIRVRVKQKPDDPSPTTQELHSRLLMAAPSLIGSSGAESVKANSVHTDTSAGRRTYKGK